MHSLILSTWLASAALAAEPLTVVVVETHPIAVNASKAKPATPDLRSAAAHAMHARIDSTGRLVYHCDSDGAAAELRLDRRAAREEQ